MIRASSLMMLVLLPVSALAEPHLTPVGAEAAANADGTIPAWDGGLPSSGGADDLDVPFPEDVPRFVVTGANLAEHAAHLAAGHRALLARHPTYRLPVYPTRRSVPVPAAVAKAVARNRGRARLQGADAIAGAEVGIPFPEPRSGVEVLWNHRLRYRGDSAEWHYRRAAVFATGERLRSRALERSLYGYGNLRQADKSMEAWRLLHLAPAQDYDDVTVVWHDPVNLATRPRRIWAGSASVWKPVRHPPVGYDQVGIFSWRIRYFDMLDMFNGAFDRYTFKLLGKREMIVPYNAQALAAEDVSDAALPLGHLRQDRARYEVHRVWVVEATLRPGEGHPIARRVFYVDEDSWAILLADCYDRAGRLDRFQEGHLLAFAAAQATDYAPVVTYDLPGERYFVDRLLAGAAAPRFNVALSRGDFTSAATQKRYDLR